MPITKEKRKRYPKNWKKIRSAILARAGNRCEGSPKFPDCRAENHEPHPATKSKVVLTIGHLDHTPENCKPENLKAWCQRCHNNYDAEHRARNRKARRLGLASNAATEFIRRFTNFLTKHTDFVAKINGYPGGLSATFVITKQGFPNIGKRVTSCLEANPLSTAPFGCFVSEKEEQFVSAQIINRLHKSFLKHKKRKKAIAIYGLTIRHVLFIRPRFPQGANLSSAMIPARLFNSRCFKSVLARIRAHDTQERRILISGSHAELSGSIGIKETTSPQEAADLLRVALMGLSVKQPSFEIKKTNTRKGEQ